jgi:membrane protease YdiL (CAAX protease family)
MIHATPRFLFFELVTLFVIFPLLYFFQLIPLHKIIPLVILFAYCVTILVLQRDENPQRFKSKANWKVIVIRFILISVLILLWIKYFSSQPLFTDLMANKQLLFMTLGYPFASAFPQEVIFREFFFQRYKPLFKKNINLIVINIILFAFAHIYFANWTIILFTLAGGLIFATTYLKTKSLLVVTIEHTLFGLFILSSGLSAQFYKAF